MKIDLTQTLRPDGAAEPYDVIAMKRALNRMGYYIPYEKVGITGIPDQRMFDAIKSFQRMNNLRVSVVVRPKDETVRILDAGVGRRRLIRVRCMIQITPIFLMPSTRR